MVKNILKFIINILFMVVGYILGGIFVWILFTVLEVAILVLFDIAMSLSPSVRDKNFNERFAITLVVYLASIAISIPIVITYNLIIR